MKILTEAEQIAVKGFVENDLMFEAVHKVLFSSLRDTRDQFVASLSQKFLKGEMTNELAGEQLRAGEEALRRLNLAFYDLVQLKPQPLAATKVHPGR